MSSLIVLLWWFNWCLKSLVHSTCTMLCWKPSGKYSCLDRIIYVEISVTQLPKIISVARNILRVSTYPKVPSCNLFCFVFQLKLFFLKIFSECIWKAKWEQEWREEEGEGRESKEVGKVGEIKRSYHWFTPQMLTIELGQAKACS